WIGTSDPNPLTSDQMVRLGRLAEESAGLVNRPILPDEASERLRRLELAAEMLPALLRVLDVREVFDRLSTIAKRSLPHDLLTLGLLTDDLSEVMMYARSDRGGADVGPVSPLAIPPAVTRVWEFDIIDDLTSHPLQVDRPPAKLGARSSLRLAIRFEDQVIGGVGFLSFERARFTSADVEVGRRLADHVAVALSHHRLAERLAENARRTEELRARTT